MDIHYINAAKLDFDPRPQMSMLYVEGFMQFFKMLLLDKKIIAKAFSHAFNLQNFYVAVENNEVVAMAGCTNGESPARFDKEICCKELGSFRGWIVYKMFTKFIVNHKFPFDFSPDMGRIDLVATAPAFRGKGIMHNLLNHIIEDAPYEEFVLDVLADNPKAISLYKSLGFEALHTVKMPFLVRLIIKDFIYMKRIK